MLAFKWGIYDLTLWISFFGYPILVYICYGLYVSYFEIDINKKVLYAKTKNQIDSQTNIDEILRIDEHWPGTTSYVYKNEKGKTKMMMIPNSFEGSKRALLFIARSVPDHVLSARTKKKLRLK